MTKRNVTVLVDGLEKDSLARRSPHPRDRQSKLAELTPSGEVAFSEAAKEQRDAVANGLTRLTKEVTKTVSES